MCGSSQDNHTLQERTLNDGGTYSISVNSDGTQPLRVTICWTDPPGTPPPASLDPPDIMLVNDLDLRVIQDGTTYYPWKMDPADPNNPAETATTGDNIRDNVEQVYLETPVSGDYTIEVSHKNSLSGGSQAFSLLMSGAFYSDQSLPVQLNSFNVKAGNGLCYLRWETQSEIDNLGFNIYRSQQRSGTYEKIASYLSDKNLQGLGNSSSGKQYHYHDLTTLNGRTYWYKLEDVDINGHTTMHGPVSAKPDASNPLNKTVLDHWHTFYLTDNYPNPFNASTRVVLNIPESAGDRVVVRAAIYNSSGKKIRSLYSGELSSGVHALTWHGKTDDGALLPSGTYYLVLKSAEYKRSQKLILLK